MSKPPPDVDKRIEAVRMVVGVLDEVGGLMNTALLTRALSHYKRTRDPTDCFQIISHLSPNEPIPPDVRDYFRELGWLLLFAYSDPEDAMKHYGVKTPDELLSAIFGFRKKGKRRAILRKAKEMKVEALGLEVFKSTEALAGSQIWASEEVAKKARKHERTASKAHKLLIEQLPDVIAGMNAAKEAKEALDTTPRGEDEPDKK